MASYRRVVRDDDVPDHRCFQTGCRNMQEGCMKGARDLYTLVYRDRKSEGPDRG